MRPSPCNANGGATRPDVAPGAWWAWHRGPAERRRRTGRRRGVVLIPITTVSMLGNFDAVQFPNQRGNPITAALVVDSGNSNMIIPNG